jgi:hypothetical protein
MKRRNPLSAQCQMEKLREFPRETQQELGQGEQLLDEASNFGLKN